jgi:hypothetical protein
MTSAKCAHPACDCQVGPGGPFGKYCSEHCKHAGKITELRCDCQHLECRTGGKTSAAT